MAFTLNHLKTLVSLALEHHASDLHIREGEQPVIRVHGNLLPVNSNKVFDREDLRSLFSLLVQHQGADFENFFEFDGSFEIEEVCRLRYNFFCFDGRHGVIFRIVKSNIPSLNSMQMPSVIKEIALKNRGLVLVTGPTGSGKSTTLAAMIAYINKHRSVHVVTIEDPIEFRHPQRQSRISQREVGGDTENFHQALRAAMRQDPDVIFIGEMRDPETVSIALKAAETGHLVLSTIHTTDAISTIGRIVSMFSESERPEVRKRLAETLSATISQRILKSKMKEGIVVAQEIMLNNTGVRECIRGEAPLSRIPQIMAEGKKGQKNKSQTFDQHILDLYQRGLITQETAAKAATNESDFLTKLVLE